MRTILKIIILFMVVSFISPSRPVFSANSLFYKELNLIGGYSGTDEWIGKGPTLKNSIGFEDYRKFSNEYGDYMTTDLQVRLSYDSLEGSEDAWAVEMHNAWLEYKLRHGNKFKAGHFDPAFGLEPVLDTHGTILQTLAAENIGFKKDWGVALKGALEKLDYKIALQLGSGMSIRQEDGSFLVTARAGTPTSENLQYGASLLYGEVLNIEGMNTFPRGGLLSEDAISKKRLGLDAQYLIGSYLFKGEVVYGEDESKDVLGYLLELDYTIPEYQNIELELQIKSWINDLDKSHTDDTTLACGISYKVSNDITLRAAYMHDLNMINKDEDDKVLLQFYYFGV